MTRTFVELPSFLTKDERNQLKKLVELLGAELEKKERGKRS